MTNRIKVIQSYIEQLIAGLPSPRGHHLDDDDIQAHLSGVSSCCVLLALRRGLDPEIAAISGLLHDIYRFKTGISVHHAHNSAEMARVVLKRVESCFTEEEQINILSAIFHHGEKSDIHNDYDELLKDADTLSPFLYEGGAAFASPALIQGARRIRLEKMAKELNLKIEFPGKIDNTEKESARNELINSESIGDEFTDNRNIKLKNKRYLMADIAEELAKSSITGDRDDPVYMSMIRYWPEDTAPEELMNGWCAAFVYHCCYEAGFILPIRWITEGHRFAGVSQWYSWAIKMGYFIKNEPGIIPERGDIVIYKNIILPENKPEEQRTIPTDHIGIVLECDNNSIITAEGNINNQNKSGIITRPLHECIEGFIRIDNSFNYSDYK